MMVCRNASALEAGICSTACISLWLTCRHKPHPSTPLEGAEGAHSLASGDAAPLDGGLAPLLGSAADSSDAQALSPASKGIAAALCSAQAVEGAAGLGPGAVPVAQVPAAALLVSKLAAQALADGSHAPAGDPIVGTRRVGLAACHRHSQALDGGSAEQWQRAALPPAPPMGASAATMLPSPASAPDLQQARPLAPQAPRRLASANGPVAVEVPGLDPHDPSVVVMQVCRAVTRT